MQIAYPFVYNQLAEEPDFKKWNEGIAAKLKLRHLTEDEKESLNAADEFNEEWEKVLFRMCQKETYLSIRAFQVSGLLNKIAEIINNDENLGEIVESVIALSAVTNLKAFDTTPQNKRKVSQAVNDILDFFEKLERELKPYIPTFKSAKDRYGSIYEKKGCFGAGFGCSARDSQFILRMSTLNPDMVDKINALANSELSKFHFDYHLGKRNNKLHRWEAKLEGDYRENYDNIKQACIEFYNAVVKL
jgi:hypothetical protein